MARTPKLAAAGPAIGAIPAVSLLPASEIERRERETLTGKWVSGVIWAIVAAVVLIVAAFGFSWYASQQLAAEQAQTTTLVTEISGLSDVSSTLAAQTELQGYRAEAMGSDLAWIPVFGKVKSALPSGVTVTGFELATGATPTLKVKPADAIGLTGTITFDSANTLDITALAAKLRTVSGVSEADAQSVAESNTTPGHFVYTVTITFDQSIYSGDYKVKAAK